MSDKPAKGPSRGRLFKLFTDIGPYFRKLQSDEKSFFFDCLEICVDPKKEPEERTFLGWWLIVNRQDLSFKYERCDGLYDLKGNWVESKITKKQQQQIDDSFKLFLDKLDEVIDVEVGGELSPT